MNKRNCESCGHVWVNRVDKPIKCPKCFKRTGNSVGRKIVKDIAEAMQEKPIPNNITGIMTKEEARNKIVRRIKIIKPNGI